MGFTDSTKQQGIDELRSILLGDDRRAMDALREQLNQQEQLLASYREELESNKSLINALNDRVGDEDALRESVVPVLSDAIKQVEARDPRPLARALSPLVVSSIRREITNSKDAMVEALYPITGRLVSAAVKNSVASMMESINRRVDEATSARILTAKFRAWRSGEPVSAYLISQPGEVEFHSAMLMERDTGAPVCHVDPQGEELETQGHSNLVSGLLAALSNLTEEVFTGENDELRTLDLNGRKITLRRSLKHLLVVEFVGTLSADQHRQIDEHFTEIVCYSESDSAPELVSELQNLITEPAAADGPAQGAKRHLWMGLGIVAVALLTWSLLAAWQREKLVDAAAELQLKIRDTGALGAYPITVIARQETRSLKAVGLIPESHDPLALRLQWQEWVGGYPLTVELAAIADAARTEQLERKLGVLRAENRALRLQDQYNSDSKVVQSPRAQLGALLEGVYFEVDSAGQLIDSGNSTLLLRRVARLLSADHSRLHVIAVVPEHNLENDWHAQQVATLLEELGVQRSQLDIGVQPSSSALDGDNKVILELVVPLQ